MRAWTFIEIVESRVDDIVKRVPVMILPDGILQHIPTQFVQWVKGYLNKEETCSSFTMWDEASKETFLSTSALADIVGLNTITYASREAGPMVTAILVFPLKRTAIFSSFLR